MVRMTKKHLEAFRKLRDTLGQVQGQEDGANKFWTVLYKDMESLGCIDDDYMDNTEKWRSIDTAISHVQEMDFKQCCTWLTWALRGERFCDGLFEGCVRQGHIKALLDQICEMVA